MAFIDADEFLVLRDSSVAAMPQLLKEYTQYGALVINWQVLLPAQQNVAVNHRGCYKS